MVDKALQNEVFRKLRKWDKASMKAERSNTAAGKAQHESPQSLHDAETLRKSRWREQPRQRYEGDGAGARTRDVRTPAPAQPKSTFSAYSAIKYEEMTPLQKQITREGGSIAMAQPQNQSWATHMQYGPGRHMYPMSGNDDTPPKFRMLTSTGSVLMSKWQCYLQAWCHEVTKHRLTHPWYVPNLSKWVTPHVWLTISQNM